MLAPKDENKKYKKQKTAAYLVSLISTGSVQMALSCQSILVVNTSARKSCFYFISFPSANHRTTSPTVQTQWWLMQTETTITTMCSFTFFYSLCLEIPGSIFSFITLLDMMHQNLLYLFTGKHWIEHKVSRWIHDWRFAHCTYNSEWRFSDFSFLFFFFLLISPLPLSDHIHQPNDLRTVWQCHILFSNLCGRFFFFLLFVICFTSTICIETIHKLDTVPIRTFVPLLLTANTDQPHTLCLCNNNARSSSLYS